MAVLRREWAEPAPTASASEWQLWRRVDLPVLAPFIAADFVLSFTWGVGTYSIAYGMVGRSATLPAPLMTLLIGAALEEDVLLGPARAAVLSVVDVGDVRIHADLPSRHAAAFPDGARVRVRVDSDDVGAFPVAAS